MVAARGVGSVGSAAAARERRPSLLWGGGCPLCKPHTEPNKSPLALIVCPSCCFSGKRELQNKMAMSELESFFFAFPLPRRVPTTPRTGVWTITIAVFFLARTSRAEEAKVKGAGGGRSTPTSPPPAPTHTPPNECRSTPYAVLHTTYKRFLVNVYVTASQQGRLLCAPPKSRRWCAGRRKCALLCV